MPKYTFYCPKCDRSEQKYTSRHTKSITCSTCNADMTRKMPQLNGSATVKETVDKFFNVQHVDDHKDMIKERSDDYYWRVEVPRLVNSGKYSVETMLELGWISINDKDEIVINTVPPYKR